MDKGAISVGFKNQGMIPKSRLLFHRMIRKRDNGFLQFLVNKDFHESGPQAECTGMLSMASSKSNDVRVMSEIVATSAAF